MSLHLRSKILLVFIFLFCLMPVSTAQKFKVKNLGDLGEFLFAPKTNIKIKKNGLKKIHRFHYFYVSGINDQFFHSKLQVENCAYFSMTVPIDSIGFNEEIKWLENSELAKSLLEVEHLPQNLKSKRKQRIKLRDHGLSSPVLLTEEGEEFDMTYLEPRVINSYCKIKYFESGFLLQIDYEDLLFAAGHDPKVDSAKFENYQVELANLFESIETDSATVMQTAFSMYRIENEINKLVVDDPTGLSNVNDRYFYIARTLFSEISMYGEDKKNWPKGLAQVIVERVMGSIPTPKLESLTRYLCNISALGSTVLLNPRIELKVDHLEIIQEEDELDHFLLVGSTTIPLHRDRDGYFEQIPFLKIQRSGTRISDNVIQGNDVLQASTGDIQLTEDVWKAPYVFVHQHNFKQNTMSTDDAHPPLECAGINNVSNPFRCTANLYHYNSFNRTSWDEETKTLLGQDHCSSFGPRNLIVPMITIYINGLEKKVVLNTSLEQIMDKESIQAKVKVHRLWYGSYKRICLKNTQDIQLLPGDKITF